MHDIVPIPSPEAAHQHCDEYRRRIAELLQGGLPVPSNPEHVKTIRMLIQYADLQITRVALWSDGPVDLLAYVTRNLLEWSLWCKVVSETPKNIGALMNDSQADLVDLLKFNPVLDPDL